VFDFPIYKLGNRDFEHIRWLPALQDASQADYSSTHPRILASPDRWKKPRCCGIAIGENKTMSKMSNNPASTAIETPAPASSLVSLSDWLVTADQDGKNAQLAVLRLTTEPAYISLFTDQGADIRAHYLEQTENWSGGYVHCLGAGCPACGANIERKRYLLLPVADLTDAAVKVLRVPFEKGPGKLLTELMKILGLPDRADILTKIVRNKNYQYVVDAHKHGAPNPDVMAAVKRFLERLNAGAIDLRSVVGNLPAEEMAQHERVAKRLALEGIGA